MTPTKTTADCNDDSNDGAGQRPDEKTEIELLAGRLAGAELNYRNAYERFGDAHIETGRMWDKMRRAGDAIRDYVPLCDRPATPALSSGSSS